jgi:hypothetical protein
MSVKSDVHPARFRHKVDVGPRTTHDVLVALAEHLEQQFGAGLR